MEFVDFFRNLENLGMLDAMLPFLLVFTLIFAVLQKSQVLGEGKRNFNVMVALVIALMVVIPHVTMGTPNCTDGKLGNGMPDAVDIINCSLPQVSIVAVAVIMALVLIGVFGGQSKWVGGSLSGWIAIIAFGIVVYIFGAAAGWWDNLPHRWGWWGDEASTFVIVILVFAIVIWYITKEPSEADKAGAFSKAIEGFGNMFKK